ncbi:protein FAM110C [Mus pahari]|uniref:protein FAM110C n=1 Tax=Mus pahari TaxID=10093 RepID=UPI000A305C53|nr:protein FAM110C [Mus pahari]
MRALPTLDSLARMRPPLGDPRAAEDTLTPPPANKSAVERLAADRAKYVRSTLGSSRGPVSEHRVPEAPGVQPRNPIPSPLAPAPVARRAIARKPLRPDSLVIYRQKCEFVRGSDADCSRVGLMKKFFQESGKDKMAVAPEATRVANEDKTMKETEATWTKSSQAAAARPASTVPPPVPVVAVKSPTLPSEVAPRVPVGSSGVELRVSRSKGLQRSQSDLSSRYSIARAESDTFFKYCGLDPEVVEALGRENFSAGSDCVTFKVRSVSMATSDSSFSRHSEDGLQEEELLEQVPSTTSVVERNARIIKWLFTCKKAKETPSQKLQGPA